MKKVITIIIALCFGTVTAQNITNQGAIWNITTDNSLYQLRVDKGRVYPVFWGNKSGASMEHEQGRSRHNGPFALDEIPVRGSFADKTPIIEVVFYDGVRDIELDTPKISIETIDGNETLVIEQKDKHYPLLVTQYISTIANCDMMEKWLEIKNISTNKKERITVENILSGSLFMPANRYFLTQHSGQWLREFALKKSELTTGIKTLQSRDFMSFGNTPWAMITTPTQTGAWYVQVQYSGNWRIDIEQLHSSHLQIVGGINFWDSSLDLEPGKSFTTPKINFGYTPKGEQAAMQLTHSYVKNEVMSAATVNTIRPVLYNSWYATTFSVEENQQFDFAKVAKEVGVELFVIDDGWFKGRKTDNAGLGDWEVDIEKFPNGLSPMIKKITDLGLDFGIWVEPEMINPNSDLYRKHPDWVLEFPNRTKDEWRYQLTLNLAREDVYQYLYNSMRKLLKENNIKFIKWDRNRGLSQPGWSSVPREKQREVRIKYMENLYRMVRALKSEFPEVIFENCSSGGGRSDLGMLALMEQTWTSDQTDPIDRLFIQYGYLSTYPANTMVCWTNNYDAHRAGVSLEFVFDVAMQGVLGIGQNISRWNPEQKDIAKRKINQYKSIRHLIQQGVVSRLKSPFEGNKVALQYTAKDGSEAVLLLYNLGEATEGATSESQLDSSIRLENLQSESTYMVEGKSYMGDYLMSIGLPWNLSGVYKSKVINVKIKN